MTQQFLALSLGFAGALLAAHAAHSAPQCGPREQVVATLAEKYGETRRSIGIAANQTVMEVFASDQGSWTITVTLPEGATCLLASGEGFEVLNEALPAKGEPT